MKNYLIVFLLFLSQLIFAPNLPIELQNRIVKEQIGMENFIKTQAILEKDDHEDLITLRKLKMTDKFDKQCRLKVREICKEVGIQSKWLYKVFKPESGGNPDAVNPYSGATGLIGFLPSTANYLGTDTSELKRMCTLDQLDYVRKYLLIISQKYKIHNSVDLYLAIFRPSTIGKPDSYVVGDKNSTIAKQNKIYLNEDSVITIKSIKSFIALM